MTSPKTKTPTVLFGGIFCLHLARAFFLLIIYKICSGNSYKTAPGVWKISVTSWDNFLHGKRFPFDLRKMFGIIRTFSIFCWRLFKRNFSVFSFCCVLIVSENLREEKTKNVLADFSADPVFGEWLFDWTRGVAGVLGVIWKTFLGEFVRRLSGVRLK